MPPASTIVLGDRYELRERIGAGGFSEVWRAADAVLGRPVAIKLLKPGYAWHAEVRARFRAEAQHAGRLSHQHIARIYDYGEQSPSGSPYLVMELVDGPSLSAVLAKGTLDPARAMTIIAQAAAGLHAAHSAGVVHRDIKPGNLLLGDGGDVKITDFGISLAVGSEPVTSTGMLVGTPGYLAPERVVGSRATPASDLYALGVVAYECLTGTAPFTGVALEVAAAHRERPLPPLPASVPARVAALVRELTAKHPAARPPTAAAVACRAAVLAGRLARWTSPLAPVLDVPSFRAADLAAAAAPASGPPTRDLDPAAAQARLRAEAGRPLRRGAAMRRALGWRWGVGMARMVMPAAAAAVVVAAGAVIAGAVGPGSAQHAAAIPSATPSGPYQPAATMVDVRLDSLVGQPVGVAARRLRRHDLRVRVLWVVTGARPPGTVLWVQPAGPRTVGTLVTLTAAAAPSPVPDTPEPSEAPPHGHHHPRGDGPSRPHAGRPATAAAKTGQGSGHHHGAGPAHGDPVA